MINCPFCSAENIEGVDSCQACGQTLNDAHVTAPASEVERSLLADRISALKPRTPITVAPNMAVGEVLDLLVGKKIGCVFVVEGDQLLGIFTERDSLMRIGADAVDVANVPVSQYMTRNPQTLPLTAKIAFAVRMMDVGGYRHIPVVDEAHRPVGAISARDILRYFAEKLTVASV